MLILLPEIRLLSPSLSSVCECVFEEKLCWLTDSWGYSPRARHPGWSCRYPGTHVRVHTQELSLSRALCVRLPSTHTHLPFTCSNTLWLRQKWFTNWKTSDWDKTASINPVLNLRGHQWLNLNLVLSKSAASTRGSLIHSLDLIIH